MGISKAKRRALAFLYDEGVSIGSLTKKDKEEMERRDEQSFIDGFRSAFSETYGVRLRRNK